MSALRTPVRQRMLPVLTYRGREGQWSWLLHRLAGLGVALFLVLHVLDIWLIGLGPEVFTRFLVLYHHPVARVFEVFLVFGVLFHALNGARIILVDFWPGMAARQRQLVYIEALIVLALLLPTAWVTLAGLWR